MSNVPEELRYTKSHEWVRLEDDGTITVGITDHAQELMGDLVYVELPDVGRTVDGREEIAVVESVKAASDIYCPIDGVVVETNASLADSPEMVNDQPYGDGWIFQLKISDADALDGLMEAEGYESFCVDEE